MSIQLHVPLLLTTTWTRRWDERQREKNTRERRRSRAQLQSHQGERKKTKLLSMTMMMMKMITLPLTESNWSAPHCPSVWNQFPQNLWSGGSSPPSLRNICQSFMRRRTRTSDTTRALRLNTLRVQADSFRRGSPGSGLTV